MCVCQLFCLKKGGKTRNILKATATSNLFVCLGLRVLDSENICQTPKPTFNTLRERDEAALEIACERDVALP